MSTVDPRVVRAEREARAAKSPGSVVAAVIVGLVHAAIWGAAGYGLGMVLDTFRLMSVNQVGEGWDSGFEDGIGIFLPVASIIVGSIFGFVFTGRMARFGLAAATIAPFCTAFFGLTVGFVLFIPSWTPPQTFGEKVPFMEGDASEPWGVWEWISYYLPYWLPAALALVFVILLVALIATLSKAQRKAARMSDMAARGTKVPGVVTEAIATGLEIQGLPRIQFTVKFRDNAGTERWVTKKSTFPPAAIPRAGDPAVVWFDPLTPGNEKSIMVGLGPDAAKVAGGVQDAPTADS
jgi:hypothetical protein